MAYDIRYPMITGASERDQLLQMKSYLHQLVDQLNYSLNNIDTVQIQYIKSPAKSETSKKEDDKGTQATFDALKPLIIKSAEIVEAYYEEINERLEGIYVAQSDFGTFVEQTAQEINKNSTDITQVFTNVQTIATEVGTIDSNVQTIDSKVKTIDSSVKTIDSTVKTVETNVQTIDSNVKNIETTIVTIDTKYQGKTESIESDLENTKTTINSSLESISNEVSNVDTELQGVKTGVQTVEQKAQTIEGNVETIATEVEGVKSGVGANLQVLEEEVDRVGSDLQGYKDETDTNIQGISENLEAVSDDLGQVDTELQGLKNETSKDINDIKGELENIKYMIIDVNAYIKSGLLYYDGSEIPIYGLEIGQRNNIDGVEVFNKFARFTSDRLSFYDQNDIEVAYISDKKLYISDVEVLRSFKIGGIKTTVLVNGDVVRKWVGGEA